MKERLVRKLRHGIDRDLSLLRVSLTVAVRVGRCDPFNVESGKRSLCFPLRQAWRGEFVADGLANREPSCLVHKAGKSALSVLAFALVAAAALLVANFASDRHAQNQRSLAAFDCSS